MKLHEDARAILENEGWCGKAIGDIALIIKTLQNANFIVHAAAIDFLRKFGGLNITFPSAKYDGKNDEVHFLAERTAAICDMDDINDFGEAIGTTLCPVGEINRRHSIVAIAEDGRVFSFFSPFVTLEAYDFEGAINNFFIYTKPIKTINYETGKRMDFPGQDE